MLYASSQATLIDHEYVFYYLHMEVEEDWLKTVACDDVLYATTYILLCVELHLYLL